ncbi:MAG: hypothetical protein WEB03_00935 [Nitriliruptor sp.]|uniref:hypothetical protein n=1 Tax=Nitriliruptor sp. TaxID=2448056 RepID=UPI00349FF1D3
MPPQDLIDALRATRTPDVAATTFARHATNLSDETVIAEQLAFLEDAPALRWEVQELEVGQADCVIVRFEYPEGAATPEGRTALVPKQGQRDPGA